MKEDKTKEVLNDIQLSSIQFATTIESVSIEKILPNNDSDEFCQMIL